ncbi:helix-turn-helix transcriptional regulator [Methylobacterium planeticum]|uniref:Addiction module antidote protein, HigA family n=1 Tax=Methylobacterium planeticum TaxID=2615211 RepID=A0A6N6MS17_9HYPH|nr:addiction module antidote protein, HigA family [Methylobacterium planeticum]KAB1072135.1 addiction module antidote protein, HigA family [Methylobacterium planeticum]
MADEPIRRDPGRPPVHPGAILREDVLQGLGITVKAMALRLGRFCGNGPGVWLRMQGAHDLWQAERALGAELAKIPTRGAAA